jgi:hypothetical protein
MTCMTATYPKQLEVLKVYTNNLPSSTHPPTHSGEGNKRKRSGPASLNMDLWADPGRLAQKLAQVMTPTVYDCLC